MKRLLLISCSDTKRTDDGHLPAIERYDGPKFRVLRAARDDGRRVPRIIILSSLYGFIDPKHPVQFYDKAMDEGTLAVLMKDHRNNAQIRKAMENAEDIFCMAGGLYVQAFERLMPAGKVWTQAQGAPGVRLMMLKQWLRRESVRAAA